ncbi:transcriptional regulator, LysR family [Oryzisolibacter propanilivorax]|uniref:Transcriptional regulator, LysR family n=1 Tax=Oryzisolibacter propanilivorax TaxID=1527607 RepID=A0A1G9T1P9_9BURK|nr:LysR family transcriptional regulator [Oryzisolibacter propanilivorax]SDM41566.1 transcriptional regulator, LysR family [Oryzisolibacter propanilivorax]
MNVTLRQLSAFLAVADTGSFTLAAERLFVTQSALSALIKELELSLGLRLFDRSTRRLRLSETGRELYPQIEKILNDLQGVISEAGNLKALARGSVRVAVPQLLACTLLPQVMAGFHALHPGVHLRLVDCAVESVMARVFSGEVDIGLGPEREANSDIDAAPLFTLPFMAVLPPQHPLARRECLQWDDLSGQPLITLQGQFTDLLVSDVGEAARDLPKEAFTQVTFMTTALALVAAGLGLTLCMPYASALVRQYGLVMRPIGDPVVERSFWIFTRRGRSLSPAAQGFLEYLRQRLQQPQAFG